MKAIEDHAVATQKLSKQEAAGVPEHLLTKLQQLDEREVGPKRNQVSCSKYPETLALYELKLVR
jgi:hypothetical protein